MGGRSEGSLTRGEQPTAVDWRYQVESNDPSEYSARAVFTLVVPEKSFLSTGGVASHSSRRRVVTLFAVGARVRIRGSLAPGDTELGEECVVVRSDARGVVVRLTSGRTTICEPSMLALLAPPSSDGA